MFKKRLSHYRENKSRREQGLNNCLSFAPFLPRLSKLVPGLIKGTYYAITSYTNVGKTPLAKFLFVLIPLFWASKGAKVKIFYFCLEESKEQFYDSMVASKLYRDKKKNLNTMQLNSMFDVENIDEETLKDIEQFENYFEWFEKTVEIITHISNPTGIYKYVKEYAQKNGKFYYKEQEVLDGGDTYIPNDPEEYVIVLTDHINLLDTESGAPTLAEAMHRLSTKYCLDRMVNAYQYIVCNVHQQSTEGENADYNKFNQNRSSITTLGDNKRISRDYHVLFALDAPHKYNINNDRGYDVMLCGGLFYRGLTVLKNRFGPANVHVGVQIVPHGCMFFEVDKSGKVNKTC